MPDNFDWSVMRDLVTWVVIPAIAWLWALDRRVSSGEREILRLLTILEERNKARDEDKKFVADAILELKTMTARLSEKIDHMTERR